MRKLSVFSFEGLIFKYPVDKGSVKSWMQDPECLKYPNVPDLPGKAAWDIFACSFLQQAKKEKNHDIMILSEIDASNSDVDKRLKFLLKTIGIEDCEIFRRKNEDSLLKFYRKNVGYNLSCVKGTKKSYVEANLYISDFEIASNLANYIIENFQITAIIHDLSVN